MRDDDVIERYRAKNIITNQESSYFGDRFIQDVKRRMANDMIEKIMARGDNFIVQVNFSRREIVPGDPDYRLVRGNVVIEMEAKVKWIQPAQEKGK